MRGIMVHSLMSRGAIFEDAYRSASAIRDKLRGRAVVPRSELGGMVEELIGDVLEPHPGALDLPRAIE